MTGAAITPPSPRTPGTGRRGWSDPASPRGRRRRQSAIRATAAALPDPSEAAGRIAAFYLAHPERHADGARWYHDAAAIAAALPVPPGGDPAGVLAAQSPQTPWSENVALAFATAEHAATEPCDGHGATEAAAAATGTACTFAALGPAGTIGSVRACEAARGYPAGDTLGGRKVRSFRAAIRRPDHPGAVVVDRHALALYYGRPLSEQAAKVLERIGAYHVVAAAYRAAARRLGVTPCEIQAATWLAWRDVHSPGWAARDAVLASLAATPGPGAGF